MSLENLSDPELSEIAVDVIPKYNLVIEETKVNVWHLLHDLYNIDEAVSRTARKTILSCLYTIANQIEINEQNNKTIGYKYGDADEPKA